MCVKDLSVSVLFLGSMRVFVSRLRFTLEIQVSCSGCWATVDIFPASSVGAAQYLSMESIVESTRQWQASG